MSSFGSQGAGPPGAGRCVTDGELWESSVSYRPPALCWKHLFGSNIWAVVADEPLTQPPGDSAAQRQAEVGIISALGIQLGVTLTPRRIVMADGTRVEVDGVSDDPPVLVEAWAHQGPPRGAQRDKVLADAMKLVLVGSVRSPRSRLILCFADQEAAKPFISPARTWYAAALRASQIEVLVVSLTVEVREQIRQAQVRQFR